MTMKSPIRSAFAFPVPVSHVSKVYNQEADICKILKTLAPFYYLFLRPLAVIRRLNSFSPG